MARPRRGHERGHQEGGGRGLSVDVRRLRLPAPGGDGAGHAGGRVGSRLAARGARRRGAAGGSRGRSRGGASDRGGAHRARGAGPAAPRRRGPRAHVHVGALRRPHARRLPRRAQRAQGSGLSLRIAVFENLPPGGALRAAHEIGRELKARGHELHLFRLSGPTQKGPFDLAPFSTSVHEVPFRPLFGALDFRMRALKLAPRSYSLFWPLGRAHRKLARQILAGSYDVVLLHHDALTQAPYALRWLDGVPTVYYCQEPPRFVTERAILQQHRRHLARSPRPVGWLRLLEDNLVLGRLAQADYVNARHAR